MSSSWHNTEMALPFKVVSNNVWYILYKELGMRKHCPRCVPYMLNADQKPNNKVPIDFMYRFVTMDKTWVNFTYETKQHSI